MGQPHIAALQVNILTCPRAGRRSNRRPRANAHAHDAVEPMHVSQAGSASTDGSRCLCRGQRGRLDRYGVEDNPVLLEASRRTLSTVLEDHSGPA
jgi:hypothetical protein